MSDFNKDELEPPSWITETFFEGVLRASEDDDTIKVSKLEITPGSGKGDHYASIMFRAKVTYDSKSSKGNVISLILKTMPEMACRKNDMFANIPLFEVEIDMYSRIIPTFEAELRKIGDGTELGAKMFYNSLEPQECIILEDLVEKGYGPLRGRLLNMSEIKAVLLKLAKWHAISYKHAAEGNAPVTSIKGGFLNNCDSKFLPMNTLGMPNFIKAVEGIDELKKYVDKLKEMPNELVKHFLPLIANVEKEEDSQFVNVLCHGDLHSKNLMFKYHANGELDDVMLLDFQVCYYGPAVLDLLYGLYLFVDDSIRVTHREELIHYYASNFIDTLKQMDFKGIYPTISDFFIDILRCRHWELFLLSSYLPMVYSVVGGKTEMEELLDMSMDMERIYKNPVYIRELKVMLPKLFHMGYLEWET